MGDSLNTSVCEIIAVLRKPEEVIRTSGTGVMGGSELPCAGCKLNPGRLGEQQVLLTTETRIQFLVYILILCYKNEF